MAVDSSLDNDLSLELLPKPEMERNRLALEWNQRSGAGHIFIGCWAQLMVGYVQLSILMMWQIRQIILVATIKDLDIIARQYVMLIFDFFTLQLLFQVRQMTHGYFVS